MKNKNLLCVKSILTIIVSISFCILCFIYPDTYVDTMKTIIPVVITFYFSHQIGKSQYENNDNKGDNNELRR